MAKSRALALPTTAKEWTQGVGIMEGVAGAGGLVAALMIPGMIVPTTDTLARKFGKGALSVACALGVGAAAKAFLSPTAGKAAVIGGIAGAVAQIMEMATGRSLIGGTGRMSGVRQVTQRNATVSAVGSTGRVGWRPRAIE